jgi:Fur family peroxide stress response transcriptional regulator
MHMDQLPKLTRQRQAILEIVQAANDHPTAADVMERLQAGGHRFAYGTVYNSLNYLTRVGLLRALHVDDGAARFDGRTDDHCHVVCSVCGNIDEFVAPQRDPLLSYASEHSSWSVNEVNLLFSGLCPACQEKLASREAASTAHRA